jgi:hypothetical protein
VSTYHALHRVEPLAAGRDHAERNADQARDGGRDRAQIDRDHRLVPQPDRGDEGDQQAAQQREIAIAQPPAGIGRDQHRAQPWHRQQRQLDRVEYVDQQRGAHQFESSRSS